MRISPRSCRHACRSLAGAIPTSIGMAAQKIFVLYLLTHYNILVPGTLCRRPRARTHTQHSIPCRFTVEHARLTRNSLDSQEFHGTHPHTHTCSRLLAARIRFKRPKHCKRANSITFRITVWVAVLLHSLCSLFTGCFRSCCVRAAPGTVAICAIWRERGWWCRRRCS